MSYVLSPLSHDSSPLAPSQPYPPDGLSQDTYRRIVRVDLKFPEEAAPSSAAQEFVRQVGEGEGEGGETRLFAKCLFSSYPYPPYFLIEPLLAAMQLLVKDPRERLALNQVEQHPWIKANADPAILQSAGGRS